MILKCKAKFQHQLKGLCRKRAILPFYGVPPVGCGMKVPPRRDGRPRPRINATLFPRFLCFTVHLRAITALIARGGIRWGDVGSEVGPGCPVVVPHARRPRQPRNTQSVQGVAILPPSATPCQRGGIVKLLGYARDQAPGAGWAHWRSCHPGSTSDLGPGLEGLGPCGSILMGGEAMAAEVEEVVDLVVGGEEALCLAG
jgi:hypothetical protein